MTGYFDLDFKTVTTDMPAHYCLMTESYDWIGKAVMLIAAYAAT
jgi:hypothetical protein